MVSRDWSPVWFTLDSQVPLSRLHAGALGEYHRQLFLKPRFMPRGPGSGSDHRLGRPQDEEELTKGQTPENPGVTADITW